MLLKLLNITFAFSDAQPVDPRAALLPTVPSDHYSHIRFAKGEVQRLDNNSITIIDNSFDSFTYEDVPQNKQK